MGLLLIFPAAAPFISPTHTPATGPGARCHAARERVRVRHLYVFMRMHAVSKSLSGIR